jgi:protein SPT2
VKRPQDLPAANIPKPPLKKGSYAEILARANAAQAIAAKVGIIKHKPVEGGLRKKDRINQRREGKELSKKTTKIGTRDNKSEKPLQSGKNGEKDKPVKSNTGESTYRGTARVKPEMPSYKGTARANNPSPTKPTLRRENMDRYSSRSASLNAGSSRYQHSSEEDDDDYESSDMEAAPFELEEEEHISLVTGKKEDEEALKEEMRLKRQKEERKKMLAAKRR